MGSSLSLGWVWVGLGLGFRFWVGVLNADMFSFFSLTLDTAHSQLFFSLSGQARANGGRAREIAHRARERAETAGALSDDFAVVVLSPWN